MHIVWSNGFTEISCCLFGVVEWYLWKEVVHDVVVRDVVEEKATHPAQEVAVNRRRRAALVVPFRLAIVGQFRVSVVQIRDHDEPASPHPRLYRVAS